MALTTDPSPTLGRGGNVVRIAPLSPCGRGAGGEGFRYLLVIYGNNVSSA